MNQSSASPTLRANSSWISFTIGAVILFSIFFPIAVNNLLQYSLRDGNATGCLIALWLHASPRYPYHLSANKATSRQVGKEAFARSETCFIHAIKSNSPDIAPVVQEMIHRGADLQNDIDPSTGRNGWGTAFVANNIPVVRLMLAENAICAADNNSAGAADSMEALLRSGTPEMLVLLESHGIRWNDTVRGETALHRASALGNTKMVAYLADHGFPVDTPRRGSTGDLKTPLMLALDNGAIGTALYLLKKGANVNRRDIDHTSMLTHATRAAHAEFGEFANHERAKRVLEMLRERGAKQ